MEYCNTLTDHLDVSVFLVFFYTTTYLKVDFFLIEGPISCVCSIFFFCSTFNSSNNFTLPDTDMCWENVGVSRIGAYRMFLVSWLLQGHKFWRWVERKLLVVMVDGLFGF